MTEEFDVSRHVIRLSDRPEIRMKDAIAERDGGAFRSLISEYTNGATEYDFGVYTVEPGVHHGRHFHTDAAELYFVTSGSCTVFVQDEEVRAEPGMAFYFPPGTVHGLETGPDETVSLIYCFSCGDYRKAGRVWAERTDE